MLANVTREQLQSIEWAANDAYHDSDCCPACNGLPPHRKDGGSLAGHQPNCWLAAALAAPPPDEKRCQWNEDDNAVWHTDCGAAWQFEAGGPTANRMKFCHNCGKALRAKPAKGDR